MPHRLLLMLAIAVVVAACSMGRPKERINPPTVSVQELRIEGDRCTVLLRVQNHSTVGMRYASLAFERLTLDGRELSPLTIEPNIAVPPFTGEPLSQQLACPGMTANASEILYHLDGRIQASEPGRRRFDFNHRSRLLPVPGLTGVYR